MQLQRRDKDHTPWGFIGSDYQSMTKPMCVQKRHIVNRKRPRSKAQDQLHHQMCEIQMIAQEQDLGV